MKRYIRVFVFSLFGLFAVLDVCFDRRVET